MRLTGSENSLRNEYLSPETLPYTFYTLVRKSYHRLGLPDLHPKPLGASQAPGRIPSGAADSEVVALLPPFERSQSLQVLFVAPTCIRTLAPETGGSTALSFASTVRKVNPWSSARPNCRRKCALLADVLSV